MITTCFSAPSAVKEAMTLVTVQKVLFISWGATLGLTRLSEAEAVEVLKKRMPHWELIGPGVLEILAAVSDTFANVVALEGSYGLILPPKFKVFFPESWQIGWMLIQSGSNTLTATKQSRSSIPIYGNERIGINSKNDNLL